MIDNLPMRFDHFNIRIQYHYEIMDILEPNYVTIILFLSHLYNGHILDWHDLFDLFDEEFQR